MKPHPGALDLLLHSAKPGRQKAELWKGRGLGCAAYAWDSCWALVAGFWDALRPPFALASADGLGMALRA
jgi:hypothetical protein